MKIDFCGEEFELLGERAIYWRARRCLILSDVHWGKSAAFRAGGIPVPEGECAEDLGRISELVDKYDVGRLVIVGDFFHAPAGITVGMVEDLEAWLRGLGVEVTLVVGNHDWKLRRKVERLSWTVVERFEIGGIWFVHDPADVRDEAGVVCGHLHPSMRVTGRGKGLKLPCFLREQGLLILAPFGTFTGGQDVRLDEYDEVYPIVDGMVRMVPGRRN